MKIARVSATQHLSLDVAHEPRSRHRNFPKLQFLDSNEFWIVRNQTPYQFECCSANEFKTNILAPDCVTFTCVWQETFKALEPPSLEIDSTLIWFSKKLDR